MGLRYLGNKTRIVDHVARAVLPFGPRRVVDIFSGTGTVSADMARRSIPVLANDHLYSAVVMTQASCLDERQVSFSELSGAASPQERYADVIVGLNQLPPQPGFFYREYAPSGQSRSGHERFYLTVENAARIDSIREQISSCARSGSLTTLEEHLLIADLGRAMNQVANIAGTYGCFLQPWLPNALRPLTLSPRTLLEKTAPVEVTCRDFTEIETRPGDVVYADPPYTKRQYAAYYHLLETLSHGDEPAVEGVTGLRPWKDRSSRFCYKAKARGAFEQLLTDCEASAVILSYSSDGHVPHADLISLLGEFGAVEYVEMSMNKYSSNLRRGSRERVVERIYTLSLGASEKVLSA